MSYGDSYEQKQNLLNYSESEERARIYYDDNEYFDSDEESMARRRSARHKYRRKGVRKGRRPKGSKGVKLIKGRVSLKVAGHTGIQRLAPAALIRYVPLNKLRAAAKKVLGPGGKRKGRVGKRKGRKRKGRKRGRKRKR